MDIENKKSKLKISVVIPIRNEEGTIREIIEKCRQYAYELLVISRWRSFRFRKIKRRNITNKKNLDRIPINLNCCTILKI